MCILSILIPTVVSRENVLSRMLRNIQQSYVAEQIEVVVCRDDMRVPVGAKRNLLLAEARGKWTTFVDDDDELHPEFCTLILKAIREHPDIDQVGYKLLYVHNGTYCGKPTYHSISKCERLEWYETPQGYFRPTTHLNPMRAEISKRFEFPAVEYGEDNVWAQRILRAGLIQWEHFIDEFLYRYLDDAACSVARRKHAARPHTNVPLYPVDIPVRLLEC